MFNLDKFIADSVTFRPVSMFAADIVVTRTCPLSCSPVMLGLYQFLVMNYGRMGFLAQDEYNQVEQIRHAGQYMQAY